MGSILDGEVALSGEQVALRRDRNQMKQLRVKMAMLKMNRNMTAKQMVGDELLLLQSLPLLLPVPREARRMVAAKLDGEEKQQLHLLSHL